MQSRARPQGSTGTVRYPPLDGPGPQHESGLGEQEAEVRNLLTQSCAIFTVDVPERRLAVRRERSAPLVAEFETCMRTERTRLSRHAPVAKGMDYML